MVFTTPSAAHSKLVNQRYFWEQYPLPYIKSADAIAIKYMPIRKSPDEINKMITCVKACLNIFAFLTLAVDFTTDMKFKITASKEIPVTYLKIWILENVFDWNI